MSFASFFNKALSAAPSDSSLPEIYPLSLASEVFTKADMVATYTKILTDALERTYGLQKEQEPLLWDNCLQNATNDGLVTMLADAMTSKSDLFLVYLPSVNVLRKATNAEQERIRTEYETTGESANGVYISFKKYRRTDMLRIYSGLEYCVLSSLHKTVNISKAVQIKMSDLRASTSLSDSSVVTTQAKSIAEALRCGKDILVDAKDTIETASPNTEPTEKAIGFLDSKRAYILGLPLAYISGLQTGGIGATGEADVKAIERGLKQYFFSILKPVLDALFDVEVEFQSQDFRQMTSALETLKTFDLVSDENLSRKSKQQILARMFDVDPAEEKAALEAEANEREMEPEPTNTNGFAAP